MTRILLGLLALALTASTTIAQVDTRRTISVEGEAEVSLTPDRASVTIGVETEGKDVAAIKKENDRRVRGIFDALARIGVDRKDIVTSDLSIRPVYNWKQDGKRELVKYQMRNVVTVTVRHLATLEDVINAGVSEGSNVLDNVSFSVSNAKTVRDSLRTTAAKDAKAKADALAGSLGARVTKPLTISEHGGYDPPMPKFMAMRSVANEDAGGTPVSAGQMTMRVTVNVTFEME